MNKTKGKKSLHLKPYGPSYSSKGGSTIRKDDTMIFKIDNAIISVSNGYIISINQTDSKTSLVLEASSIHRTLIDLSFADDKEKEFTELILAIFLNKIAERLPDNTMIDFDDIYNEVAKELADFITEKERESNV